MNRIQGASIQELYDALEEMRKIYKYDVKETYFGSMSDEVSRTQTHIEIHTKDPETGVYIIMQKDIDKKDGWLYE